MTILKFSTTLFGTTDSAVLSRNPTHGRALAELLRTEFSILNYKTDEVITETDWGWAFHMQYYHKKYMVGTLAYSEISFDKEIPEKEPKSLQYLVQFDKVRTLKEKIFGQNKFTQDEPIIDLTVAILKFRIPDMTDFSKVIESTPPE